MPDQVCRVHAIEFWTGLLAFTSRRAEGASDDILDHDLAPVAANDIRWNESSAHSAAA